MSNSSLTQKFQLCSLCDEAALHHKVNKVVLRNEEHRRPLLFDMSRVTDAPLCLHLLPAALCAPPVAPAHPSASNRSLSVFQALQDRVCSACMLVFRAVIILEPLTATETTKDHRELFSGGGATGHTYRWEQSSLYSSITD